MAVNLNICILSGTIIEDPQIVGEGDGAWAFGKLMTSYVDRTPEGGFTDVDQVVPIVANEPRHVNTLRQYVKRGKAVTFEGFYRTWVSQGQEQHGFFIRKITFSKQNWGAEDNRGGGGYPAPN